MSIVTTAARLGERPTRHADTLLKALVPVLIAAGLALLSPPAGLAQHAWYYFALFAAVVAALVLEPLPSAAVGFVGVSVVTALAPWVLLSPADLGKPGFSRVAEATKWALSGFSSSTVWLVGGAFMFAMAYDKTGLGRRIALVLLRTLGKSTLRLGFAAAFAEGLLAIVTPSNTARGAGTVFPVLINVPPLYDSNPNEPSRRRVGAYLLFTAFAANCITSTLFVTGCAPNFLALDFARKIAHVEISWFGWFKASAPFAIPLLLLTPLILYLIYPPQVKRSPESAIWAAAQLSAMGPISRREITLVLVAVAAVLGWIFGGTWLDAAMVAFLAISVMLVLGVFTWEDMARNHAAWTTIVLLATLVTLADGLSRVGFVAWFAGSISSYVGGFTPTAAVRLLVLVYFLSHYMFASLTAHTSAMFPITLATGMAIPGVPVDKLALALALVTGLMGVITPYATGAALPYYNSGYIKPAEFWALGFVLGGLFLAALVFIGLPLLMA